MQKNSLILRDVVQQIKPDLLSRVEWFDIWERPIDSGIGYEWTVFTALIKAAENNGWQVKYPILDQPQLKELFVLRNEIPYQHGAQAGHSFRTKEDFSLSDRFLASLLPKAILTKDGLHVSVFKEGSPYHKIMYTSDYLDRPDIILVAGMPTVGFPYLSENSLIEFSYDLDKNKKMHGQLRVVDTNLRPIKSRYPVEGLVVPTIGIIECSVNKKLEMVKSQTKRYMDLFKNLRDDPKIIVSTGNELSDPSLNLLKTQLDAPISDLVDSFSKVGQSSVEVFLQGIA